jgi:rhodanese-related sulfurtransferase
VRALHHSFITGLTVVLIVFTLSACSTGRATRISVRDTESLITVPTKAVVLDVNDAQTRYERGIVPGAVKLSSYNRYSMDELPKNNATTLIFYCYGTICPASDIAADRAIDSGYTDVRVMKAGIVGWNKAHL